MRLGQVKSEILYFFLIMSLVALFSHSWGGFI
jgi:hypothetical protein